MSEIRGAIRVDGRREIGLGHVYRTLALAEYLQGKYSVDFYTQDETAKTIIETYHFKAHLISSENSFLDQLNDVRFVVFDGYHFRPDLHQLVKKRFPHIKCVQIDDEAKEHFELDGLINHNSFACEELYDTSQVKHLALGSTYLLLRREFARPASFRSIEEIKSVFLAIGGTDPHFYGQKLAERLAEIFPIHFTVLSSSPGPLHPQITYVKQLTAQEMREQFVQHDLAITSASMTAWEAISVGIPLIVLSWASNQIRIGQDMEAKNLALNVGIISDESLENILHKIKSCIPNTPLWKKILQSQNSLFLSPRKHILSFFDKMLLGNL